MANSAMQKYPFHAISRWLKIYNSINGYYNKFKELVILRAEYWGGGVWEHQARRRIRESLQRGPGPGSANAVRQT